MKFKSLFVKECYRCGIEKKLDCFGKNKAKKDGLEYVCRECRSKYVPKPNKYKHASEGNKICHECLEEKPLSEFFKNKVSRDGMSYFCKKCDYNKNSKYKDSKKKTRMKNIEAYRLRTKKYSEKNAELIKEKWIKKTYGLSREKYKEINDSQGGVCAICRKPENINFNGKIKRLSVDHCHKTGVVRGLLCQKCNVALGNAKDNIEILKRMIAYLENFSLFCKSV